MNKETVNYKSSGSVVVKRSPVVKIKGHKNSADFHKSVSQNIHSLNRVLKESNKIIPITNSVIKSEISK